MTTPTPPNADEFVSAYVDGELAPDQAERVERDPALVAQADSLRAMLAELRRDVAEPDASLRESHLAAALVEFDLMAEPENEHVDPGPAVSLDRARERRRPRRTLLAGAAAAAMVMFASLAILGIGRGGEQDVATGASEVVAVNWPTNQDNESDAGSTDADSMVQPESLSQTSETVEESIDADGAAMTDDQADTAQADGAQADTAQTLDATAGEAIARDDAVASSKAIEIAAAEASVAVGGDAEADFTDPLGHGRGVLVENERGAPVWTILDVVPALDLFPATTSDQERVDLITAMAQAPIELAQAQASLLPASPCQTQASRFADLDTATLVASASLEATPVEVHTDRETNLFVLVTEGCELVAPTR